MQLWCTGWHPEGEEQRESDEVVEEEKKVKEGGGEKMNEHNGEREGWRVTSGGEPSIERHSCFGIVLEVEFGQQRRTKCCVVCALGSIPCSGHSLNRCIFVCYGCVPKSVWARGCNTGRNHYSVN